MDRRKILLIVAAVIAALGAMLVWLYVQGADSRAQDKYQAQDVYVVAEQINSGDPFNAAVEAGKIVKQSVPKVGVVPNAMTSLAGLDGQVALSTMYPGEQVLAAKWGGSTKLDVTGEVITIPKGMVAISMQLNDPQRVAGFVLPGSKVAVIVSNGDKTKTIFNKPADVIGVGSTSTIATTTTSKEGDSTTAQSNSALVTLALSLRDAEKIVWSTENARIALALLGPGTTPTFGPTVDAKVVGFSGSGQ